MMNPQTPSNTAGMEFLEKSDARQNTGWLLFLGITMAIIGTVAIVLAFAVSVAYVFVIGIILAIAGLVEGCRAFTMREWGGFFLHLIVGFLYLLMGCIIVIHPVFSMFVLTLVIAIGFIIGGVFRIVASLQQQGNVRGWGWGLFDGLVMLALGLLIWAQWPESAMWVIGMLVGVALIFNGWTLIFMATAIRNMPMPIRAGEAFHKQPRCEVDATGQPVSQAEPGLDVTAEVGDDVEAKPRDDVEATPRDAAKAQAKDKGETGEAKAENLQGTGPS